MHCARVSSHRRSEICFPRENGRNLVVTEKNKNFKQHDWKRSRRETKRGAEEERERVADQTNAVDAKTNELWTLSLVVKVSHLLSLHKEFLRCASLRGAESYRLATRKIFSVSSR